tara:strand:+ start:30 stop:299 length:270 start_codon:yes stop_codon:yes gene_type:complete
VTSTKEVTWRERWGVSTAEQLGKQAEESELYWMREVKFFQDRMLAHEKTLEHNGITVDKLSPASLRSTDWLDVEAEVENWRVLSKGGDE